MMKYLPLLCLLVMASCAKKVNPDLFQLICEVETERHQTDTLEDGFLTFGNQHMDLYLANPGSAEELWGEFEKANNFCRGPLLSLMVDVHPQYLLETWPRVDELLQENHRTLLLSLLDDKKPAGYEEVVFYYLEHAQEPLTRKLAAVKLTGLDQGSRVDRILARFEEEKDGEVLVEILAGLDAINHPKLYQAMVDMHNHPSPLVHETIMTTWATSDLADKRELISRYLNHPNAKVVYHAKGLLESLKGKDKLSFTAKVSGSAPVRKDVKPGTDEELEAFRDRQRKIRDALVYGRMDEVDTLIEQGGTLSMTAYDYPMAHSIIASVSDEVLKELFERGIDPKALDGGGNSLIHAFVIDNFRRPIKITETKHIWMKIPQDKLEERLAFLMSLGIDVNLKNGADQTALIRAAMSGKLQSIKALLANGADIGVRDSNGRDALMWARLMEHEEITALLEEELEKVLDSGNK